MVDYTIEDAEVFQQLKQQCLYGAFKGFKYIVDSKVIPKNKEYIFRQCDKNGCILLHYAAQGGCILIVDEIIDRTSADILESKCIRGQNALHFAIRYKHREMTEDLIIKYSNLKNASSAPKNLKKDVMKEFSPIHWVAWHGDQHLLHSFKQRNFDITTKTRNGLNILDIACMSEEFDGQILFCKHLLENEYKNIDLKKTDLSEWNIAHYASMCNFKLFKLISDNEKLCHLVTEITKSGKTCLHIACQSAKFEIVEFIVTRNKSIAIDCADELGWNALHFAAKGGNLQILEYLLENNLKLQIGSLTKDGKTILHIACFHKHVNICKYAIQRFPEALLNHKNSRGMTAAHYLGVQCKNTKDKSTEEILKILCESKMDLTTLSSDGYTVLQRAIDYSNIELIQCLVSDNYFRDKCDINLTSLKIGTEQTKNSCVRNILEKAIGEIEGR